MKTIAVIDYAMGNLRSVSKALEHVSQDRVIVTDDAEKIAAADRVVLPGVGAIRDCISALTERQLIPVIQEAINNKPTLGICLGMQAFLDSSCENPPDDTPIDCLGFIPGTVERFVDNTLKIPHMGWNRVHHNDHPLWHNIQQDSRYYFVHSYYRHPSRKDDVSATTDYGLSFACAIARDNLFAVQFHPEKSQDCGLQLLKNFSQWTP